MQAESGITVCYLSQINKEIVKPIDSLLTKMGVIADFRDKGIIHKLSTVLEEEVIGAHPVYDTIGFNEIIFPNVLNLFYNELMFTEKNNNGVITAHDFAEQIFDSSCKV